MSGLNSHVHVRDEHGVNHVFGPGDTVPKWARDAITNPDVWDADAAKGAPASAPAKAPAAGGEPTRTGKGSGAKAWKAHATSLGITVLDGAAKPDIIALVDASKNATAESKGGDIPGEDATVADWVAYAAANGLEVDADDDVTVDDLIKVLDANDVKTK